MMKGSCLAALVFLHPVLQCHIPQQLERFVLLTWYSPTEDRQIPSGMDFVEKTPNCPHPNPPKNPKMRNALVTSSFFQPNSDGLQ